jgi:membrane-bound serine protease (ClpP class)
MTFPIVLQVLAFIVIIGEIFLPSGGLLSIIAASLAGYSLYLFYTDVSSMWGLTFLIVDLVSTPFVIFFGFRFLERSPLTLKRRLSREDGVVSQPVVMERLLGAEGTVVTDLRPSGIAIIEGDRYDVIANGDYLEKGTPIVVSKIVGNQMIVDERESDSLS